MKPHEQAKALGCKSLAQVARATKRTQATVINWANNEPELFEIVCLGVAVKEAKK